MTLTATLGQSSVRRRPNEETPMSADRTSLALRVDVLGPLRLHVADRSVEVPGLRRGALLTLLAPT